MTRVDLRTATTATHQHIHVALRWLLLLSKGGGGYMHTRRRIHAYINETAHFVIESRRKIHTHTYIHTHTHPHTHKHPHTHPAHARSVAKHSKRTLLSGRKCPALATAIFGRMRPIFGCGGVEAHRETCGRTGMVKLLGEAGER